MSAYVVSKSTLDVIVSGVLDIQTEYGREVYVWQQAPAPTLLDTFNLALTSEQQRLFDVLMHTCVQGVSHRYPGDDVTKGELPGPAGPGAYYLHAPRFQRIRSLTPAEIAKAVSCYEYQTSEHEDWPTTVAYWVCESLTRSLTRSLPGYREAPWDFDDDDVLSRVDRSVSIFDLGRL